MKAIILISSVALVILSGCGLIKPSDDIAKRVAQKAGAKQTIVFQPGFEIAVNGRAAMVVGVDACPGSYQSVGLTSAFEGKGCVVITPSTSAVKVTVTPAGRRPIQEVWQVSHRGKNATKVYITRPGGYPVVAFKDYKKRYKA